MSDLKDPIVDSVIENCYDSKGNGSHYMKNRLNSIEKFERIYGTEAVMVYCEITADKYRERMGKKKGQSIEQEALKISWYERASQYYFLKLNTEYEIKVDNRKKVELPF